MSGDAPGRLILACRPGRSAVVLWASFLLVTAAMRGGTLWRHTRQACRGELPLTNATVITPEEQITSATPQHEEKETALESLASICTVLAVGLFVMTFIFQNFEIPSASMEKTLLIGDHVLVDRVTLAPRTVWAPFLHYRDVQRGDIIVFLKPGEPDLFLVKRAIAVPGDRIHLEHGIVYLNGVAQNEPQAGKPADDGNPYHAYNAYRDDFPAVPPGPGDEVTASWALDLPNHL